MDCVYVWSAMAYAYTALMSSPGVEIGGNTEQQ